MDYKVYSPPAHIEIYLTCIDVKNPPVGVVNWIKEDKLYKLNALTEAINTDDQCLIISDCGGIIKPSAQMSGFMAKRFKTQFEIILN